MTSCRGGDLVITGVGITTATGQGRARFTSALLAGEQAFDVMRRPGRQSSTHFIGAELPDLSLPPGVLSRTLRGSSLSARAALVTVYEAWQEANLEAVDPCRIGLIVGGSNIQQRELVTAHDAYAARARYMPPSYAVSFLDSDVCGLCTEQFGIRGASYTIGGASASGQLAVIQAAMAVASGEVDVAIAVGALMDLSYWECCALRSSGAMGSDSFATEPQKACRPFDRRRDGFIFGESCAALVIERLDGITRPGVSPQAVMRGWAVVMDAHRGAEPSPEGQVRAITCALRRSGLSAADIDYINPHGSGSVKGDESEIQAIRTSGLAHARINATKSLVGHGLTSAGAVEIVATLVQMSESGLHPTRNLDEPIDSALRWIGDEAEPHIMCNALSLSFGFGGINTALCLSRVTSSAGGS